MKIPANEVVFHPLSYVDSTAKLFWWHGGLYRAVTSEKATLYRMLFDTGLISQLVAKKLLVETELTALELDDYDLVLKHRTIPFVSYGYEWCAPMLKDAALTILALELELLKHNLTLQDAHQWNVLFDGCTPVFVDFGSIVSDNDQAGWYAYSELRHRFIYPLRLASKGYGRIGRWLLHDRGNAILAPEVHALTDEHEHSPGLKAMGKELARKYVPPQVRSALRRGYTQLKFTGSQPPLPPQPQSALSLVGSAIEEIEAIALPRIETEWSSYYNNKFPPFYPSESWTPKHHSVYQVLTTLRPASVLDIGSNRGWHAQLAASLGCDVVAFDVDEMTSAQLYDDVRGSSTRILPLVMDFTQPSPASGLCYEEFPAATERLKCDMVMALALVHHLVFKKHLNFAHVVRGLRAFTKRWLLVEFISANDKYVSQWWTEQFAWYTLENFRSEILRHFRGVSVLQSEPEPRVLLLCEV